MKNKMNQKVLGFLIIFLFMTSVSAARVPCFSTTYFATDSPHKLQVTLHKYDNYNVIYGCKPGPEPCSALITTKKSRSIRSGGYISSNYSIAKYYKIEKIVNGASEWLCDIKASLSLNKEGQCLLQYSILQKNHHCQCDVRDNKGTRAPGDPGKPDLDTMGKCQISAH